ncbi:alpha/beta hydrolase fold domain-containing protein [Geodermatophilus nigrescens]
MTDATTAPAPDGFLTPHLLPPPTPYHRADGTRHHPGVVYAAVSGYRALELDLWVPATVAPPPVVVWVHGGAWMVGNRHVLPGALRPGQLVDELLAAGLAVASVEYRHAREARFPAQLHDVKAAVRWLRHHAAATGIDPGRVGIAGESAGGHLAALVALTADRPDLEGDVGVRGPSSHVDVVVDWYGVADAATMPELEIPRHVAAALPPEDLVPPLEVLLDGVDAATREAVSPLASVHAGAPPFLLLHGTADRVVPHGQSERLAAALRGAGADVRLESIPGAGHGWDGCADPDAVVAATVRYLADGLRPGAPG